TQDGDVRTTEIYSEWIGKNGELSTGNVWKNVFATAIKRNYAGNISVVSCGYLRQEHI
ncbi:MAG: hypothetical protein RLZZ44_929, partial [Bacteroidota bacterium]